MRNRSFTGGGLRKLGGSLHGEKWGRHNTWLIVVKQSLMGG